MAPTPVSIVTSLCGVRVRMVQAPSLDENASWFFARPLTDCCGKVARRVSDGTARCSGCFSKQSDFMADSGWRAISQANAQHGCPIPHDCADQSLWELQRDTRDFA